MRVLFYFLYLCAWPAIAQVSTAPGVYPDRIILNLSASPGTAVGINWRTAVEQEGGWVEYAVATPGAQFMSKRDSVASKTQTLAPAHPGEGPARYHSVLLSGLKQSTTYVYRVGEGSYKSEWFQFTTPGKSLEFLFFGDAQNDVKAHWSRILRQAFRAHPEVNFMLHGGDLINRHNRDIEWAGWFEAGGFIHSSVPSAMAAGNHEFGKGVNNLSAHWKAQFTLPENGPDTLTETCYSIHFDEMVLAVLDATMMYDDKGLEEKSLKWLDQVLGGTNSPWKIVMIHFPLYSTKGNRDNKALREALQPVLEKHQVDLVLSGHDHAYGRGIREIDRHAMGYIVSNSGPKHYEVGEEKDWMQKKGEFIQLYQHIKLDENQLQYRAYTAEGVLFDEFKFKKVGGKNTWIKE